MSIDPAREALHRIAREMGVATALDPQVIATTVIKRVQNLNADTIRLGSQLEQANHRMVILEGDIP